MLGWKEKFVEKSDSGGTTKVAKSFSNLGERRNRSRICEGSKYIRASCMKHDGEAGSSRDVDW